eukprot:54137_1
MFVVLVCLSGGCYSSLCLVSSAIFGMNIFNSGLTKYELRKCSYIKLSGTMLENIPQLFLQIMYSTTVKEVTSNTALAFFASSVSVLSTILDYFIQRQHDGLTAVAYYVETYCHTDDKKSNVLTDEEELHILDNKGKTEKLAISLSKAFAIPEKNIEITKNVVIAKTGAITYVIHHVSNEDLQDMEEYLNETEQTIMTAKLFVSKLYEALNDDISKVFAEHFEISYHRFNTRFVKRDKKLYAQARKNNQDKKNRSFGNRSGSAKKRYTMLRKVITTINIADVLDNDNNDSNESKNENDSDQVTIKYLDELVTDIPNLVDDHNDDGIGQPEVAMDLNEYQNEIEMQAYQMIANGEVEDDVVHILPINSLHELHSTAL